MITLSIADVVTIHDSILETEKGAQGYHGDTKLGGALGRIQNQMLYDGLDDLFDIAAWYVEAIAMGHCFADCNKRTALPHFSSILLGLAMVLSLLGYRTKRILQEYCTSLSLF